MKFFGRQNEIKELQEIRNLSLQTARFTIVTGRRANGSAMRLETIASTSQVCRMDIIV